MEAFLVNAGLLFLLALAPPALGTLPPSPSLFLVSFNVLVLSKIIQY